MNLVLASQSPRRKELLGRLGIPFDVSPSEIEERPPHPGEDPVRYAEILSLEKAQAVAVSHPDAVVLGSDTVVAVDGAILNKPEDEEDALRMLRLLRGRTHIVVTAVTVVCAGTPHTASQTSRVTMRDADDDELRDYVATGEPMDKAGAYAVQGGAGRFVTHVSGCYDTVVGLPLCSVQALLERCGIAVPRSTGEMCRHHP